MIWKNLRLCFNFGSLLSWAKIKAVLNLTFDLVYACIFRQKTLRNEDKIHFVILEMIWKSFKLCFNFGALISWAKIKAALSSTMKFLLAEDFGLKALKDEDKIHFVTLEMIWKSLKLCFNFGLLLSWAKIKAVLNLTLDLIFTGIFRPKTLRNEEKIHFVTLEMIWKSLKMCFNFGSL